MIEELGKNIEKLDTRLLVFNLAVITLFLLTALVGVFYFKIGYGALIAYLVLIIVVYTFSLVKIIVQIRKKLPNAFPNKFKMYMHFTVLILTVTNRVLILIIYPFVLKEDYTKGTRLILDADICQTILQFVNSMIILHIIFRISSK